MCGPQKICWQNEAKDEIGEKRWADEAARVKKVEHNAPQVSVALSAAVTEVGVALHTGHMIASLRTLNMNLQAKIKTKRGDVTLTESQ